MKGRRDSGRGQERSREATWSRVGCRKHRHVKLMVIFLPLKREREKESGILPHRDPFEGICLLPIRAAWKLYGFTDEIWTMARKVGTRGSCRLNEAISQIIRLEDMLIFLP